MARRIDQDLYDEIIDAFRENPGNFHAVSQAVGCSWRTAKKAWTEGWEKRNFGPVEKVIELEELEARAVRLEEEEQKLARLREEEAVNDAHIRAQARRDAIAARAEEAKMVKAARASAVSLLEASRKLSNGIEALAPQVRDAIKSLALDAKDPDIDQIERIAKLLWRVSISTRASSQTAFQILQAERLLLGQPTDIIGVTDLDKMGPDEAMAELENAAKTLQRMRERKKKKNASDFRVLEGGKAS